MSDSLTNPPLSPGKFPSVALGQVTPQARRQSNDPIMNTISISLLCSAVCGYNFTRILLSLATHLQPKSQIKKGFLHVSPGTAAYRECSSVSHLCHLAMAKTTPGCRVRVMLPLADCSSSLKIIITAR